MPRLIDANDLLMDNSWAFYDENGNRNDACIAVENAPTVEAIPVVRCKDCENWVENEHCLAWAYEYSDADGFCYFGKRKDLIRTPMSLSKQSSNSQVKPNEGERRKDETN